jgi:hypothetical protein
MRLRSEGVRLGVAEDLFARVFRSGTGAQAGPSESSKASREEVVRGVVGAILAQAGNYMLWFVFGNLCDWSSVRLFIPTPGGIATVREDPNKTWLSVAGAA